jgi:hypothetical protein
MGSVLWKDFQTWCQIVCKIPVWIYGLKKIGLLLLAALIAHCTTATASYNVISWINTGILLFWIFPYPCRWDQTITTPCKKGGYIQLSESKSSTRQEVAKDMGPYKLRILYKIFVPAFLRNSNNEVSPFFKTSGQFHTVLQATLILLQFCGLYFNFFYGLLTVHLSITLVINQFNAQNLVL